MSADDPRSSNPCPNCDGTGNRLAENDPAKSVYTCTWCKGTGKRTSEAPLSIWRALLDRLEKHGSLKLENHGHRRRKTGCEMCLALYALADAAGYTFRDIDGNPEPAPRSQEARSGEAEDDLRDWLRRYGSGIPDFAYMKLVGIADALHASRTDKAK